MDFFDIVVIVFGVIVCFVLAYFLVQVGMGLDCLYGGSAW